ncbi:MAG TPA: hypothetical protein VGG33_20390, partial [Polyangia bacterium]
VREGGDAWLEVDSPHARIFTDMEFNEARLFAYDIGIAWHAMTALVWPGERMPPANRRVDIVVFKDRFESVDYTPSVGVFQRTPLHPGYVITDRSALVYGEVLVHELAHALSFRLGMPEEAPQWYVEGIACFLQTIEYDYATNTVSMGKVSEWMMRPLIDRSHGPLDFDELWSPPTAWNRGAYYGTAWLLLHYLYNNEPEGLASLQRALSADARTVRARWLEFFPKLPPTAVRSVLANYLATGQAKVRHVPIPRPDFAIHARPLEDSRIHSVMAVVSAYAPELSPRERKKYSAWQVRRALAEDPLDLWANKVQRLFLRENRSDLAGALRLTAKFPSDPDAWLIAADSYEAQGRRSEAGQALKTARDLGFRPVSERRPFEAPQFHPPR